MELHQYANAFDSSISNLVKNNPDTFLVFFRVFLQLLRGIVRDPDNVRLRKISTLNTLFAEKYAPVIGSRELLAAAGFVEEDEDHFILPDVDVPRIEYLITKILQQRNAISHQQQRKETAEAKRTQRQTVQRNDLAQPSPIRQQPQPPPIPRQPRQLPPAIPQESKVDIDEYERDPRAALLKFYDHVGSDQATDETKIKETIQK